jgi:hypothetical protein
MNKEAYRFLAAISHREMGPFTFFTTCDKKRDRSLTTTLTGTLDDLGGTLTDLNRKGAGVFVTVNETDGLGRKAGNITRVRALFTDADAPVARPYALTPRIVVQTPRGEHAYWRIVSDEPLGDFTPSQRQLAAFYGTDPTVCDLPRVMRLPGFYHWKGEPKRVWITTVNPWAEDWTMAEVREAHPVSFEPLSPRSLGRDGGNFTRWAWCHEATEGTRNRTAFSIAAEGFRRCLDDEDVAAVVTEWCAKAGIRGEAVSIIRSARRHNERRSA